MQEAEVVEQPSFARTFLLPALAALCLPLVGALFTTWKLSDWSADARDGLRQGAAEDPTAPTGAELDAALASFDIGDMAVDACGAFGFFASPEGIPDGLCNHILQFVWIKWTSFGLLALAALLFALLSTTIVRVTRDPRALTSGFRLGWTSLRLFGIPHIVGQGLILLFLSFWITAIFFEIYVVKLIVIAGCLGAAAAVAAIKALFARAEYVPSEQGIVLAPNDAPDFFAHVRALAQKVGTAPPSQVVVGIDDNFFVTEMPFDVVEKQGDAPRRVEGRSLYASLSLLRALTKDEGDAILAHELAHFRAGDTALSRELNPLLRTFEGFMQTIADTFTFGVGAALVAFRAFYERAARLHGRAAEFAADRVSKDVVGAASTASALWKTAVYARYRGQVEGELFEKMEKNTELKIAERVSTGFVQFIADPNGRSTLLKDALAIQIAHPFDSHPAIVDRLRALEVPLPDDHALTALAARPSSTLCEQIPGVEAIEAKLWSAYEAQFAENLDFSIALRLLPKTPDELAHLERFFPSVELVSKEGPVHFDWERVLLPDGTSLPYRDIGEAKTADDTFGGQVLVLELKAGAKHKLKLGKFDDKGQAALAAFGQFWQRHHIATAHAEQAASSTTEES